MDTSAGELGQLVDEMDGVFTVVTDAGDEFCIDLDARRVTTLPAGDDTRGPEADARLLTLVTCRVGAPMVMLIDRGVPGVWFTRRLTSPVARIIRVTGRLPWTGQRAGDFSHA